MVVNVCTRQSALDKLFRDLENETALVTHIPECLYSAGLDSGCRKNVKLAKQIITQFRESNVRRMGSMYFRSQGAVRAVRYYTSDRFHYIIKAFACSKRLHQGEEVLFTSSNLTENHLDVLNSAVNRDVYIGTWIS